GRFAFRRRVPIIIVWAVVFVVMGTFAKGLQDRLGQGGWEVPGPDSLQVQHLIQQRFGEQPATAVIAIHSDAHSVSDPGYLAVIAGVTSRVKDVPDVRGIEWANNRSFVSPDGRTTFLIAGLSGDQNHQLLAGRAVAEAASKDVPEDFQVQTGGASAFY